MGETKDRRELLRELGRQGGKQKAANARRRKEGFRAVEPYPHDFLTFRDAVGRGGPSRALWEVVWRAAEGLPLTDAQRALFQLHTGRSRAPSAPCKELWIPAGRRSGKSENMALRATWRAISRNWHTLLAPGEVGIIPIFAADRSQSRNSSRYVQGLAQHHLVAPFVAKVKRESIEFTTGAIVACHTASWRTGTRGYTFLDVDLDEVAFYLDEDSANPDEEIIAAVRPAMLTVPDARLYAHSSPYARKGVLYRMYDEHWGKDDSDILVFNGSTESFNPTVDTSLIRRAREHDPARAAAEYGADGLVSFRNDVEGYITREALLATVISGRYELPPQEGVTYRGFVDPSGGSRDSFVLAIAHQQEGRPVLDCVRELRSPLNPESATSTLADLAKSYRLRELTGDAYSGVWVRDAFLKRGVRYTVSEKSKSVIYGEVLALLNAGTCELLDHTRMLGQVLNLERRTARGGRDSIDHPSGGSDDVANAALGALLLVAQPRPQRRMSAYIAGASKSSTPLTPRPVEGAVWR